MARPNRTHRGRLCRADHGTGQIRRPVQYLPHGVVSLPEWVTVGRRREVPQAADGAAAIEPITPFGDATIDLHVVPLRIQAVHAAMAESPQMLEHFHDMLLGEEPHRGDAPICPIAIEEDHLAITRGELVQQPLRNRLGAGDHQHGIGAVQRLFHDRVVPVHVLDSTKLHFELLGGLRDCEPAGDEV